MIAYSRGHYSRQKTLKFPPQEGKEALQFKRPKGKFLLKKVLLLPVRNEANEKKSEGDMGGSN